MEPEDDRRSGPPRPPEGRKGPAEEGRPLPGPLRALLPPDEGEDGGPWVGLVFEPLRDGARLGGAHRAGERVHAASTMKVAVLAALARRAGRDPALLATEIRVRNRFQSLVEGEPPFSLDAEDDEDPDLHRAVGEALSVGELARRMVVKSSNLATNLLLEEVVSAAEIQRELEARDEARATEVRRGVGDLAAFERGWSNRTCARDLMAQLAGLWREAASGSEGARWALSVLEAQRLRDGIPAGCPAGATVANKTGSIEGIAHDAALLDPRGERAAVLVVLTRGFPRPAYALRLMRALARAAWDLARP